MNNNNVKKYDESYSCKVIYVKLYAKKDVDQKRDQHLFCFLIAAVIAIVVIIVAFIITAVVIIVAAIITAVVIIVTAIITTVVILSLIHI